LEQECRRRGLDKVHYSDFDLAMEVFANYSLVDIERSSNKKDAKNNKLLLMVELTDLTNAMNEQMSFKTGL